MIEKMKQNAEGKPIIRPVNVMGERHGRKVNDNNDKLITQEQFSQFIRANHHEQVKYWLGNGRGKHTKVVLKIKCPHCNCEEAFTIKNKGELKRLLKRKCAGCAAQEAAHNQHLDIPLPFGKFKGATVNFVMVEEPTYLAWFVDKVKGQDLLIEQIKTHTRFPEAWAEYTAKQAVTMPKERREEKEWQEGRFSQQTIDNLFNCFFGGQHGT